MNLVLIGDIGGWPTYHVGDEAMLEANLARLTGLVSGGRIQVLSQDPQWSTAHYNTPCLESARFPEGADRRQYKALVDAAVRCAEQARDRQSADRSDSPASSVPVLVRLEEIASALRDADALVISGGGNLCSTWPHLLYERIALMRMARSLGKKILVLSQTVGPELIDDDRLLLLDALRDAEVIVLRESPSYELLLEAGFPAEQLLYDVDDAFGLSGKPWKGKESIANNGPWIAVTLTTFFDPDSSPNQIMTLAEQLNIIQRKTGSEFVFIPHVGEATGTFPDEVMGHTLAKLVDGRMWVIDRLVASEVCWLTGQASMIISNRYHPLVFGVAANIPSLGLYACPYTRAKLEGALGHAGLQQWAIPLHESLHGELAARAVRLWETRETVAAQSRDRQSALREGHERRWQRIAQLLKGS